MESKPAELQQDNSRETRIENLRPHRWQPGQSGNPKGRPKRVSFMDLVEARLPEIIDEETGMTMAEALVEAILRGALKGDSTAIKELLARWEPAPKQNININNNVGEVRQDVLEWLDRMKVYCPGNGKAE